MRALIYLLSIELYGEPRPLSEFPKNKNIKGFGLTDDLLYAIPLVEKFDYVNTFYDRQPYFDMTEPHPERYGTYDFILSSDVFEHVAPPVERAFEEAGRLLKPNGFLCITVPSSADDEDTVEYYPDLHEYSIVELGGEHVLINRKRDKTLVIHRDLEFHGGVGATLVMRLFSQRDLARKLQGCGFSEVVYQTESVEPHGIIIVGSWSRPLVARKERYTLPPAEAEKPAPGRATDIVPEANLAPDTSTSQLDEEKAELERRVLALESKLRLAADSRWLKLGRRFGLGPKLR
jgi:SAM-dependent methyltransferase